MMGESKCIAGLSAGGPKGFPFEKYSLRFLTDLTVRIKKPNSIQNTSISYMNSVGPPCTLGSLVAKYSRVYETDEMAMWTDIPSGMAARLFSLC